MKRKTTISLTVAALLSLSGMVYAANHVLFSFITGTFSAGPIGVAGSADTLLATQYCDPQILSIDCVTGLPSPLATVPGYPSGQCLERYLAVAPAVSATAGFAPRDIFITQGNQIFQFSPPAGPLVSFTTIPACGDDHTGITFDHVGPLAFNYDMIISCENGTIWKVDNLAGGPHTFLVGTLPINIENEGPAVAPLSFGPFGGQILVTNDNDAVNAIRNDGFVTLNAFVTGAGTGPESVQVIPQTCVSQHPTITQNPATGAVTAQWNAPTAGTYIISIKYSANSVVGSPAPSPGTTVHYDFMTTGVPGSTSGLDLVKK